MCSSGWTALLVVGMAVPALASGPADTAAKAPVSLDITKTRWEGTYQVMGKTYRARLVRGDLQVGRFDWRSRLVPGTEPSGPCTVIGIGGTFQAIYRLERGRLFISSSTRFSGPRPTLFRVTPQSDLWTFEPAPGK